MRLLNEPNWFGRSVQTDERAQPARPEDATASGASWSQDGTARARHEPGLEQQRHDLRVADGLAVEALDGEPLPAAPFDVGDEGRQRLPEPVLLGLPQRDERAAAALDVQRRLAAEQDHVRPCDARGPGAGALRPRQRSAVGLRRVGRRKHEGLLRLAVLRLQLPQPLDRAAESELRAAETLDEVAAATEAQRLERLQLTVDRAVAAGYSLGANAVTDDNALPLEHQLGERPAVGAAGEEPTGERPAALRRGDLARAPAREAPRRPLPLALRLVAPPGAQRGPRVVGDLAGPDEIPQRRQRLLRFQARVGEEVVPEERAPPECRAQPLVHLALRPVGGRRWPEHRRVAAKIDGDAVEPRPGPDDLARSAERIQLLRPVTGHAAREHLRFPERDRKREPLQRHERLAQGCAPVDALPRREEAAERRLLGRLDLAPKRGQRRAAQAP